MVPGLLLGARIKSLTVVLGAITGLLAVSVFFRSSRYSEVVSQRETLAARVAQYGSLGHSIGPDSAELRIVVAYSYHCAFSIQFQSTIDSLLRRLPDFVAIDFVPNTGSLLSTPDDLTLAADCAADQGAFEEFHRAIYDDYLVATSDEGWKTIGEKAEVEDLSTFRDCVLYRIAADRQNDRALLASELGIRGTPTTFIGGIRLDGAVTLEVLMRAIKQHGRDKSSSIN